jgi:hypothetical protein
MDKVLQSLSNSATSTSPKTTPRRINLYCDTLVLSGTVLLQSSDTFFCNIAARQIIFSTGEVASPAIRMSVGRNSRLGIYVQSLPTPFQVEFEGEGTPKDPVLVSIPEGAFGMEYTLERGGGLKDAVRQSPPDIELDYENWMNLVNDDGTLKGVPFLTE